MAHQAKWHKQWELFAKPVWPRVRRVWGEKAGETLRPVIRGLALVSLCGHAAVLAPRGDVIDGPGWLGRCIGWTLTRRLPVPFVHPVKWHHEEHGGGGNDGTAESEDVEVLARPVHQNSYNNNNNTTCNYCHRSRLPQCFMFDLVWCYDFSTAPLGVSAAAYWNSTLW